MKTILFIFILLLTACSNRSINEDLSDEIKEEINENISDDFDSDEEFDQEVEEDIDFVEFFLIENYIKEKLNEYSEYKFIKGGSYIYYNSYVLDYLFDDITVKSDYIKLNTLGRPGIKREVKWIVIHDTGNLSQTADALNHAKYLHNSTTNSTTSWHYTVDMHNIINHIPDDEVAYHAGDGLKDVGVGNYLGGGNKNGIGVEMCVNKGNDLLLTYKRAAKLIARLLYQYNLDISKVNPHQSFSGKMCPYTMIYNSFLDEFYDYVEEELYFLTNFSNYSFELVDLYNVRSDGYILDKNYHFNIVVKNKTTNLSYKIVI